MSSMSPTEGLQLLD